MQAAPEEQATNPTRFLTDRGVLQVTGDGAQDWQCRKGRTEAEEKRKRRIRIWQSFQ